MFILIKEDTGFPIMVNVEEISHALPGFVFTKCGKEIFGSVVYMKGASEEYGFECTETPDQIYQKIIDAQK